jgi:hypothetical protein
MILHEIYNRVPAGYQDVGNDNSQPKLGDLRKSKLTLSMINQLNRLNNIRMVEYSEKLKDIKAQYAPPAQPGI